MHTSYTLGLLAIFKNEAMNMREFIEHYTWQGIQHFFLIDNGSSDDSSTRILQEYIDRGTVTLYSREQRHAQTAHYNDIYLNHNVRRLCKWLLVCDLDEFVFSANPDYITLLDYVSRSPGCQLESVSDISMSMRMFGSRDAYEHPNSIRDAFLYRERRLHPTGKAIVRCSRTHHLGIHFHDHEPGSTSLDGGHEYIRLNHYIIQSREYFDRIKRTRGDVHNDEEDSARDDAYFENHDIREVYDPLLKDLCHLTRQNVPIHVIQEYMRFSNANDDFILDGTKDDSIPVVVVIISVIISLLLISTLALAAISAKRAVNRRKLRR